MSGPFITIGDHEIEVSLDHIYLSDGLPSTYDYVPWNIVKAILTESQLTNFCLIDIGANVGDSLAHFRRFSDAPVICIEPSSHFFDILGRNASLFENVKLVKRLVAPISMRGEVKFWSDDQTGSSTYDSLDPRYNEWSGDYIAFDEIINDSQLSYVVKTDTDGFDVVIVNDLIITAERIGASIPIIFFEGPHETQTSSGKIEEWLSLFVSLQSRRYGLLFLTNRGMPYVYAGTNIEAARSALNALVIGHVSGKGAICHYFDIIAIHEDAPSKTARLSYAWGSEIFDR